MNSKTAIQTQTTQEQMPQKRLVQVMADKFNLDPGKLLPVLKDTCFKGASDEQMVALLVVANEYSLNPFTKEIYAFPAKGGGIVPVVGIDGWLRIINEHPEFDGMDVSIAEDGGSCTVTIHRKDRKYPTIITEYLEEVKRATDPWKDMPRRMLRHKAIIQCARVAFSFSGIKDEEDAAEIIKAEVVDTRPLPKMTMEKADAKPEDQKTIVEPQQESMPLSREPGVD
jgi:hypothetical protein